MDGFRKFRVALMCLLLTSCAGWQRTCSSSFATTFGSDWIIVQFGADGRPFNCWRLEGVSVANEEHSDGIYWQSEDGHLVHISGFYNRVQVSGSFVTDRESRFASAARKVGIDLNRCHDGAYTE